MEKAIYGLAAQLDQVDFEIDDNGGITYKFFDLDNIYFAKNIVLTLGHEPKKIITSTNNRENGELILVQKGYNLYFKFIPTTKDGERIYRYVKQRKLRQCSYIARIIARGNDLISHQKIGYLFDENEKMISQIPVFQEVCLTNEPANAATFCTTDVNHTLLCGITWQTNIEQIELDFWEEYAKNKILDDELKSLMQELQQHNKKTERLLKERGILQ